MRLALPLLALAFVCAASFVPRSAAEDKPARVPGTIRLEGDPDALMPIRVVQAFPHLRFDKPLYVGHVPDGSNRMVVLEQDGRMLLFPNRRDVQMDAVVVALDWRGRVYRRHSEEGLLGLAFHPNFRKNHEIFLHYSDRSPRRGVVARFKMDRAHRRVQVRTQRIVLEQRQPWGNHNAGGIEFGPDGYLYIPFGDGGAGGDPLGSGQDLSTWLGTMLRIDVDGKRPYAVPRDNPFVGRRGVRPEIWAYGLRNVWRFSFDRMTGTLWAGDVGQNAWEEIDILEAGGNYGWNRREGAHAFRGGTATGTIDPIVEHDTSEARSITGGYVYRGKRMPALRGTYLYADYATGNIWGLRYDGAKVVDHRLVGRGRSVASFGEDADGEVYFTSFDGRIYTFAPRPARRAGRPFPRRLSETGLFTSMKPPRLHASLLPYDVNVPLWSDGVDKTRHVMLPGLSRIRVASDGGFTFPDGTIFVKTFHAPGGHAAHRLETRLFARRNGQWAGYTYVWNEAQTDAELIDGRIERALPASVQRAGLPPHWTFPSRADCMSCHTDAGGRVLGFEREQLLRGDGDSLARLVALGVFDRDPRELGTPPFPAWDDAQASNTALVRAYLDANCAMCHQPGAPGNASIDLRHDVPRAKMGLLDATPGHGTLGLRDARLVVPGSPTRSVLLERMRRTDEFAMPTLGHHRVDKRATKRVAAWIRDLGRHR